MLAVRITCGHCGVTLDVEVGGRNLHRDEYGQPRFGGSVPRPWVVGQKIDPAVKFMHEQNRDNRDVFCCDDHRIAAGHEEPYKPLGWLVRPAKAH